MRSITRLGLVAALGLGLTGCEKKTFTQPMKLGGKMVSAETLNHGKEEYTHYCYACHGAKGDGHGPAAPGLRPPPRNFTIGKFKFAAVSSGQLPNDADFFRIVKGGLHGTAMLPWDIPDPVLASIVQYIKTFSPRWQSEMPGEAITPSKDPYGAAKKDEAIAQGKKIYHGLAQCWSCHPAYATRQEISEASKELRKVETSEFRDNMYQPALKESDYKDTHFGGFILPPDFMHNELRSIRNDAQDPTVELGDLYRVIASGIGGTAMPQWKGSLPEEHLWAMAYYVRSLTDLRKDARAVSMLRSKLASQPPLPTAPPAPTAD